jgi:acetylornithine deacetylase/succinyl-diaminopimelate desuccinylase-like protein
MSAQAAIDKFARTRDMHLQDLSKLVRIPSVSASGFDAAHVQKSAEAVAALLRERGLENVELLTLPGAHPYVYGDWLHAPGKPTVLLYAHHDVQPPGREDVWKTPPFEPTMGSDGRLYGRGAADDKAGIVAHTATVASWLEADGKLPCNVKVIIEGEEEIGSSHLYDFVKNYKQKLAADVMVLTDAGNWDTGIPALTTLLRGIVGVEIELKALESPLHSGMWGGPIPDPVMALSRMLATLVDADGRILVPGLYDDVRPLSDLDRKEFERLPTTPDEFRRQSRLLPGVQLLGKWITPWQSVWREPALTVNAIQAASRAQAANIICDSAWARVTVRIVPDQDPKKVQKLLLDHLKKADSVGAASRPQVRSRRRLVDDRTGGPGVRESSQGAGARLWQGAVDDRLRRLDSIRRSVRARAGRCAGAARRRRRPIHERPLRERIAARR